MNKYLYIVMCALLAASCSEEDDTWDAYSDWAARNATWFHQVADSARNAIREAQQQWGPEWEAHCVWRMYQSTTYMPDQHGAVTDSICLKYISDPSATVGAKRPLWTDSVRVNYRGYLMTTDNRIDGVLVPTTKVFDQSYYGPYNPATAYPQQFIVSGTVPGYATALQHMRQGDEVMLYIPQELGYGGAVKDNIPAYSTLRFHLALIQVFHADERVTSWQ